MESLESYKEYINKKSKESLDEEENEILNKYEVNEKELNSNSPLIKRNKKKKLPLLFYIYIISVLLFIASFINFIVQYIKKDKNYRYSYEKIFKSSISEFKYSNLTFDNGLEVLLIQVAENDTAGGTIIFDAGYLDNQYKFGNLKTAFNTIIDNKKHSIYYSDYLGKNISNVNEYYSYFSFEILNDGFFKYLEDIKDFTYYDYQNWTLIDEEINKANHTNRGFSGTEAKEKLILEYIIYGCKIILSEDGDTYLDERSIITIKQVLASILQPNKIKIVLASHFKPSMMKKKFLYIFKDIINSKKTEKKQLEESANNYYNETNFVKKKIILLFSASYHNYIKINYFIDKDKNENYFEFINKLGYFKYIKYILDETNEGSLYNQLNNLTEFTINNISCDYEVILKNKIRFSIKINLAPSSYAYLEKIIFLTYQYINKLIKYVYNQKIEDHSSRLKEINKIDSQNLFLREDSNDIMSFTRELGSKLLDKKNSKNLFKDNWIESFDINISNKLFSQFVAKNSVIIIVLNDEGVKGGKQMKSNIRINNFVNLFNFPKKTQLLNVNFSIIDLETDFENEYKDDDINIIFHNNEYISNYMKPITTEEKDKKNFKFEAEKLNGSTIFREFRYLRDTRFKLPKVHIAINLYHPFIRPGKTEIRNCYYLEYILFMTFIKREINEVLSDAIRAGNKFLVGYNQNYIYINIFAFTDIAEKIAKKVKEIIMDESNKFSKIHESNDTLNLYIQSVIQDYTRNSIDNISAKKKFYLYYSLNPNLFNYYVLNEQMKNRDYFYDKCYKTSKDINAYVKHFILDCQIYGFFGENQTKNIVDLFKEEEIQKEDKKKFYQEIFHEIGLDENNLTENNFKDWILLQIDKNAEIDSIPLKNNETYRYYNWSFYNTIYKVESSIFYRILDDFKRDFIKEFKCNFNFIYYNSIFLLIQSYNNTNNNVNDTYNETIISIRDHYRGQRMHYNEKIDVIGTRFYYIIKHIIDKEFITPRDMENNAFRLLNSFLYIPDNLEELSKKSKKLRTMDYNKLLEDFNKIEKNYIDFPKIVSKP